VGASTVAYDRIDEVMAIGSEMRLRPLRIALVTQGFDSGGGVSTVVKWLRSGLESTGTVSVDIHDLATWSKDGNSRRLAKPRTWVRRSLMLLPGSDDGVRHWGANAVELEWMRYRPRAELTKVLRDYDLIQVVNGEPALAAAVTKSGPPVVLQVATTAKWERESQFVGQGSAALAWRRGMAALTSRIERSALRDVDAVLVENDAMLKHVRSLGQLNVVKAPPGLDTDLFRPGLGGWRRDGYLLSVCRLGDARKGLDRMVLAYAEMVRLDAGVPDLVLAGLGELAPTTVQIVRSLNLTSKVRVRSNLSPEELVDLYQGASVFLQTSFEEGLGMSVLEAMACGLPIVSTDTAGSRETVIHGETGWLVAQGPDHVVAGEVAKRVLAAVDGEGGAMGAKGRDRCLRMYSLNITLSRFTASYDALTRGGHCGDGVLPTQS
jgi:glycosyltransferase involved in cell wall biosynthesis